MLLRTEGGLLSSLKSHRSRHRHKMKILAVDDIKQSRYLLRKLLEGYGYIVETAENGIEALEKSRELALYIGAADYLVKPVEPDQFIKTIVKASGKHERGKLKSVEKPLVGAEYMKRYSERLIRKLEGGVYDPGRFEKGFALALNNGG